MKCLLHSGELSHASTDWTELRGREEMYRGGGLFSVTSKILVNDFLSTQTLPEMK
jgi:hypothetical protein